MDTWKDKVVVASIDFGTTFSGYAISFRHDYDQINPVILTQSWKCGDAPSTPKTPTCVLLNPDHIFHSFGYEAERKYAALAEDEEHHNWHLFRRFKMLLYKDKENRGLTMTDKIKDTEGREFPAINIFTYAILYMKDKIIELVRERVPSLSEDDIYYVLTTPAIWSQQAKAFMRKAARNARIKDDHLRIALEPECAAIYLHKTQLPALDKMLQTKMAMKTGSCHVIVDLGGGTVDIATHRVSDDGKFEEVIPPCGGPWGSDNINMEFENFVIKMSGGQVFHSFKKDNMEDYLSLQRTFEHKKCAYEDESSKVTIVVPESFRELHKNHNSEDLSSSVRQMDLSENVEFKMDKMRIHRSLFNQFFEPTIDGVVQTIKGVLAQIPCKIDTICCVGGFSDSNLLKKRIKEEFSDKTVVIPSDAITTVMKGAVVFGRDQSVVNKRIIPYTIGLDWNEDFDSNKHPRKKREETEDGCLCTDIFKILIRQGDSIQFNMPTKEIDAYPKSKYQHLMEFPFYRSEILKEPRFVTDPGCYLIGSMQVNISEEFHGGMEPRCIKLKLFFGAAEVTAEATDEHNRKHQVSFTFEETQV